MKQHYEEKLVLLQEKIQATVKERDSVLASYGKGNNEPTEKVKKIKEDYEKRLADMQREMKSLQTAKREHSKLLKNQSLNENQIRTLSNEISEMKRTKVKLMNKMKEESQRHKEAETKRNREIAVLKKQSRIDANRIKKMEAEKRANSIVLKRKHEEVAALRTAVNRKPWMKTNGRPKDRKQSKQKWVSLEKNIAESTINKQSISALEKEMVRKIESRAEVQEELNQKKALLLDPLYATSRVIREEVENLQANLDHIQTSIRDLQNEILQVEENKVTFESGDVLNTIVDPSETSYILEKLYNMALHQSCLAAQNDSAVRELQAENEQLKKESEVQEQLLRHLLENREKSHGRLSPNGNSSSTTSSRSTSPIDNGSIHNMLRRENGKQRKKMMAPQDLLFQNESTGPVSLSTSYHSSHSHSAATSPEHHPAPGSNFAPPPLTRSFTTIKEKGLDASPPGSPPVYRRQTSREENVFSRLTSQLASSIPMSTSRKPGKITNYNFPKRGRARLQCTNIVEGHSKAVLALHATDDYLFTASKDRTVVVWDLRGMRESQVFGNFPNSVVAVKYDPQNNLLFSVSSCYIKVWDIRSSKAIRTLNSQGNSTSWSSQSTNFESTNLTINAIALSENSLYTAVCDRVRVWDLRKFSVVGKLLGGHQAAIMCLAVSPTDTGEDVVVTGSKDHYIKIFNVGAEPGLVVTPATLEPPHYDGIQCLALRGETLFSGSRDYVIKKWNLDSHELVTSVNAAHRDWVTDLCCSQ
uniref:Kinesin-like protein KIF21A n=1 Tax=Lygus hesperus TaxID=30085 RepID=A0A0A9XQ40_LYGHE